MPFRLLAASLLAASSVLAQVNILTYHNDNARTGQNLRETILTPAAVNQTNFGKLFSYPVDGRIYAQPLYMSAVMIPGLGARNVVFVATQHDSVYAFDANSAAPGLFWQRKFLNPPAVTSVPAADVISTDIVPEVGITGTPVIDAATGTLYVVPKTKEMIAGVAHYIQRLHALDVATGLDRPGSPVVIADTTFVNGIYTDITSISMPGAGDGSIAGQVRFNALREHQRSGLVLSGDRVYVDWASHGDRRPYHGWVVGFNKSTLAIEAVFNTTPNGRWGGIWMAGAAPAADSAGNLFLSTGNGTFAIADIDACGAWQDSDHNQPPCNPAYGDAVLRLSPTLHADDFFVPNNQAALERVDTDLGSGGVLLLPDQPAPHPHLMVTAGKEGRIYLIDRDNLGAYQRCGPACDDVVQVTAGGIVAGGSYGEPAFFDNKVYYQGANDVLKAFPLVNGQLSIATADRSRAGFGFPGATPSISASGTGNAIAWVLQVNAYGAGGPSVLHAYDAKNLSNELYSSSQAGLRDQMGGAVKFTAPIVADGKVYAGSATALEVFGLFPATSVTPDSAPLNLAASTVSFSEIDLSWTNKASNSTGVIVERSLDGTTFTRIALLPRNVSSYADQGLAPSTVYFYRVRSTNQIGDSAGSNVASTRTRIQPPALRVTDVAPWRVDLAWTRAVAALYSIERSQEGGPFQSVFAADGAATSFSDTIPYFGTIFYRIRALGAAGDSAVSNTVSAIVGPVTLDRSGGFSSYTGLTANGSAKFVDSLVQLTDGGGSEAGSFFSTARVGIRGFTTSFRFRVHEGTTPRADGFTFIIQSNSPNALGATGGALGYGGPTAADRGIRNSVAVKFDFYNNSGEGVNSTGVFTDGRPPTVRLAGLPPEIPDRSVSLDGTGIDLATQSEKMVELSYDGAVLTETITDLDAQVSFTQSYTLDIARIVGAETAYVGFAGGTGGLTAIQDIQTWFFDERENDAPPRSPSGLRANSTNTDSITIQWKSGNAYTAELYVIERSADGLSFTPIATVSSFETSYTDRTLDPGIYFYRVRAFDAGQRQSGYSNVDSAGVGDGFRSPVVDYSAGFSDHAGLTASGSASFAGTVARLTNSTSQAGSLFTSDRVGIKNFTTSFMFTIRPGSSPMADGMAFVIQNNSPAALGPGGGGLGYGPDTPGPNRGIGNSVAVKFDVYSNAGEGANSTGLFTAGRSPTVPEPGSGDVLITLDGTGLDLKSTNPFQVQIIYSGGMLDVTITDTVTQKSAHQSYLVDIVSNVGGNQAYVGFTAGTGGLSAIQEVLSWSFQ